MAALQALESSVTATGMSLADAFNSDALLLPLVHGWWKRQPTNVAFRSRPNVA